MALTDGAHLFKENAMSENGKVILWVNVPDLQTIGTLGVFGSPINLMVHPDLGDEWLDWGVSHPTRLDEMFMLLRCTKERAEAIQGGLEVIGKRKMKRAVRTKITQREPTRDWKRCAVNK